MAIKAIAMDIDGTLTNDQKVISPRTREKLLAAQESGIKLILASGRPAWGLHALAHAIDDALGRGPHGSYAHETHVHG